MDINTLFDWAASERVEKVSLGRSGKRKTTAEFIAEAVSVHGFRYDYSRVEYKNAHSNVEIICPEHGPFQQSPHSHRKGQKCPQCANRMNGEAKRLSNEEFIQRAKEAHGDLYDYSKVEYTGNNIKVCIGCPVHGDFWQSPAHHMNGHGCRKCGDRVRAVINRRYGEGKWGAFIAEAIEQHGDRYDYSKSVYDGNETPIEIICRIHGSFFQKPSVHRGGSGCLSCANEEKSLNSRYSFEDFVTKASSAHADRYDYSLVEYNGSQAPVLIICKDHGEFWQRAENHWIGSGCPSCAAAGKSRGEQSLAEFLESNDIEIERNDRQVIRPRELDIVVPSSRLAVEYHGTFWHSDRFDKKRDREKHELVAAKGYRLITVWEHDWQDSRTRPIVERMLLNACGASRDASIGARKCDVRQISVADAREFLDAHHIQGGGSPQRALALYHEDAPVAVMTFARGSARRGKYTEGEWELHRYATSANVQGGGSRLFKEFVRQFQPDVVWSYSDVQHFDGALYPILGFKKDGVLSPDYRVWHRKLGIRHKSSWKRASIPTRLEEIGYSGQPFDPANDPRTERDIQDEVKALRVYDSGKIRWKWTR